MLPCSSFVVTDQLQHISSTAKHKLLCNLSSQLQSVCSVMICQLDSSLMAQFVSSTAIWQLSCDVSAQLSCDLKAQLQLVNSAVSSAATCQLSCTLSAQIKVGISAASCWLSWSLSAQVQLVNSAVSSAAPCQLRWNSSSQLHHVGWAVVCLLICTLQKDKFDAPQEGQSLSVGLNNFKKWFWFWHTAAEPAARSSPENIYCESKVRGVPLRGYYRALGTSLSPILCLQIHFELFWPNLYCVAQAIGFCANLWHLLYLKPWHVSMSFM